MNQKDLDFIFQYHAPTEEQKGRYALLRTAGEQFAAQIVALTPPCADQSAAIRKVREAVFTANAAIALNGAV